MKSHVWFVKVGRISNARIQSKSLKLGYLKSLTYPRDFEGFQKGFTLVPQTSSPNLPLSPSPSSPTLAAAGGFSQIVPAAASFVLPFVLKPRRQTCPPLRPLPRPLRFCHKPRLETSPSSSNLVAKPALPFVLSLVPFDSNLQFCPKPSILP